MPKLPMIAFGGDVLPPRFLDRTDDIAAIHRHRTMHPGGCVHAVTSYRFNLGLRQSSVARQSP
jgi:hypothetical protein